MEQLYGKAIAAYETHLGADHPEALEARFDLAHGVYGQKRPAEALAMFQKVLPGFLAAFGPDHPHTARCQFFIGNALLALAPRRGARCLHPGAGGARAPARAGA